jgi:hypothetical protein
MEGIESPAIDKEKILFDMENQRAEQITWIKKLLSLGFTFTSRNVEKSIGHETTLSSNGGAKVKQIAHSRKILDEDLK